MNTRAWILAAAIAAGLIFTSVAATGQPTARPARIAFVLSDFEVQARPVVDALHAGLLELGHVEGRSYQLELRYAQGQMERLPALISDVIERGAELLVTSSYPATAAAKHATRTIPIAGYSCGLEFLVDSVARPGGNVSGVTCQSAELVSKQLQLMWEVLPTLKRIAVFYNPASTYSEPVVRQLREVGSARGTQVIAVAIRSATDFDSVIAQARQADAEAVFLAPDELVINLKTARMLGVNVPQAVLLRADEVIE